MDFSNLLCAIFYRPEFRSEVCQIFQQIKRFCILINFGLQKLGIEAIKENQRKVIEGYLSGRDVLMVAPTRSGKSLTFQISPFAIDFWKHGNRSQQDEDVQTVCLVIAPLVSHMKDQVSILRAKQIKGVMIGPESTEEENKEAKEGKYNLIFASIYL